MVKIPLFQRFYILTDSSHIFGLQCVQIPSSAPAQVGKLIFFCFPTQAECCQGIYRYYITIYPKVNFFILVNEEHSCQFIFGVVGASSYFFLKYRSTSSQSLGNSYICLAWINFEKIPHTGDKEYLDRCRQQHLWQCSCKGPNLEEQR